MLKVGVIAKIFISLLPILVIIPAFVVLKTDQAPKKNRDSIYKISLDWYQHALDAERYTDGYRGPVAARMYGYLGLAAYEAARPFLHSKYRSLSDLYHDAIILPVPDEDSDYYLPAVLNACYSLMLDSFYRTAPAHLIKDRIDLNNKWLKNFEIDVAPEVMNNSLNYGREVANVIFNWSALDLPGHEAYLRNYDECYEIPEGDGLWQPCPDFPMPPLLPNWGQVRPLFINTENYLARKLPVYSSEPGSLLYDQAFEVFNVHLNWSAENRWIAEFWSDDHPGLTFTPVGRWISITNQVMALECPPAGEVLEAYLKMGLALHNVTVACWYSKYHYRLERPETFIRSVIDSNWNTPQHTPPFPSYPSGHSMLGMAASEVLTRFFGGNYKLTDLSHADRIEFRGTPRHYNSFDEMARENAASRVLLGVHFRIDCEEGLRLGKLIGNEIASLPLKLDQMVRLIP